MIPQPLVFNSRESSRIPGYFVRIERCFQRPFGPDLILVPQHSPASFTEPCSIRLRDIDPLLREQESMHPSTASCRLGSPCLSLFWSTFELILE